MTMTRGADGATGGGGTVLYLYAVCRADGAPDTVDVPGAAGARPRLVTEGGLAAVVASLPADEYGAGAFEARLQDLERLEGLARSHNAVVDAFHARTTVLPMRLATVYLDDTRVADVLRERAAEFVELLDRLDERVELGVKVYAIPSADIPAVAPGAHGEGTYVPAGGESPGRAYLRRRQARRRRHRDAYRTAGEVAARLPVAAAPLARARVAHRPHQGELAAHTGENIANEAYLVARSDVADFRRAMEVLAAGVPGVHVEVTGPWAPYSFADATSGGSGGARGRAYE